MKFARSLVFLFLLFSLSCVYASSEDVEDVDEEFPQVQRTGSSPPPPISQPVAPKKDVFTLISSGEISKIPFTLSDFSHEIFVLLFFGLYGWFHFTGVSANKKVAKEWAELTENVWKKNFAHVGDKSGELVVQDSPRDYIFYASGRVHCRYIYGFLKCAPRHDILSRVTGTFLPGPDNHDRVTFNIALNDEESSNFVFFICPKHRVKEFLEDRWDLETFGKLREIPGFPNKHYALITDANEFAQALVAEPKLLKLFWASVGLNEKGEGQVIARPMIESLEIIDMPKKKPTNSDQIKSAQKRCAITIALPRMDRLGDIEKQRIVDMAEFVVTMIDAIGQFGKLSVEASNKLKKARENAAYQLEKEEAKDVKEELSKKKAEAKKQREEELSKLSVEARRAAEEKDRKKEERKQKQKNQRKGRMIL